MKIRITLLLALVLSLLVTSQAVAGPGKHIAKRAAKAAFRAELDSMGRQAFRAEYGRHAMRSCIRAHRAEAIEAVKNAAQECRAEREADAEAFAEEYGTNRNKRNAFGKCVAQKVHEALAPADEEAPAGSEDPVPPASPAP